MMGRIATLSGGEPARVSATRTKTACSRSKSVPSAVGSTVSETLDGTVLVGDDASVIQGTSLGHRMSLTAAPASERDREGKLRSAPDAS